MLSSWTLVIYFFVYVIGEVLLLYAYFSCANIFQVMKNSQKHLYVKTNPKMSGVWRLVHSLHARTPYYTQ